MMNRKLLSIIALCYAANTASIPISLAGALSLRLPRRASSLRKLPALIIPMFFRISAMVSFKGLAYLLSLCVCFFLSLSGRTSILGTEKGGASPGARISFICGARLYIEFTTARCAYFLDLVFSTFPGAVLGRFLKRPTDRKFYTARFAQDNNPPIEAIYPALAATIFLPLLFGRGCEFSLAGRARLLFHIGIIS